MKKGTTQDVKPRTDLALSLRGARGDAGAIMLRARKALREGHLVRLIAPFTAECLKGDYDHLLETCRRYFVVSG